MRVSLIHFYRSNDVVSLSSLSLSLFHIFPMRHNFKMNYNKPISDKFFHGNSFLTFPKKRKGFLPRCPINYNFIFVRVLVCVCNV